MSKGYLIAEIDVQNAEQYAKYTAQTPAAIAKHGGKFVVRGGACDGVEGQPPQGRGVVIEFASLEEYVIGARQAFKIETVTPGYGE